MNRIDIINSLIAKYGYKSYLEIGVNVGDSIRNVNAQIKVGVDPVKQCEEVTHEMPSDEFFASNKAKFDIVFIDGLHTREQSFKDFQNSLEVLNSSGVIVMHDCSPHSEYLQTIPPTCSEWTGDTWKSIVDINYGYGYESFVVDTDYGVGVFFPKEHKIYNPSVDEELTWEWLVENRVDALRLISVEEFKNFTKGS